MDELNLIIADNIYTLRRKAGMTQFELAEKLNYTDKLISKWERGESVPNTYTMKALSEVFEVSVDELYTDRRAEHLAAANGEAEQTAEGGEEPDRQDKRELNLQVLTAVIVAAIALTAAVVFVVLWIVLKRPFYSIFVYALPAMLSALLVFNSIWNKGKHNFVIIGALAASVVLTVYVALLPLGNFVQLFVLLFPGEFLVWLTSIIKRKADSKRRSRLERAVQLIREKSGFLTKND